MQLGGARSARLGRKNGKENQHYERGYIGIKSDITRDVTKKHQKKT